MVLTSKKYHTLITIRVHDLIRFCRYNTRYYYDELKNMNDSDRMFANNLKNGFQQFIHDHALPESVMCIYDDNLNLFNIEHGSIIKSPRSQKTDSASENWHWKELISQKEYNAGILCLDANKQIPIHDHPGSSGLLFVLHGELEVTEYRQINSQTPLTTELVPYKISTIKAYQFCSFGKDAGNIHSIKAINKDCFILDILISPYDLQQRKWYLPIENEHHNNVVITMAMRKKANFN